MNSSELLTLTTYLTFNQFNNGSRNSFIQDLTYVSPEGVPVFKGRKNMTKKILLNIYKKYMYKSYFTVLIITTIHFNPFFFFFILEESHFLEKKKYSSKIDHKSIWQRKINNTLLTIVNIQVN